MRSNLDYQRFEIIGGLRSHLLLFFFGRKNMLKKKQLVQDLIPPPSIYMHMCILYTYTNTYMPRFSKIGLGECDFPSHTKKLRWLGNVSP